MRNLKALGLTLVAALAFSAMVTASAQAEAADFWANANPAQIDVTGESDQIFTVNDNPPLVCGIGQSGETTESVHGEATLAGEALALTTENIGYTNCHTNSFGITFPVTVDMNGCDYHFTAGTMTSSTTAEGSAEIRCPEGNEIAITAFNSGDAEHKEAPRCVIHIPPQKMQGAITYHNITHEGKMAVTVSTDEVAATWTKTDENTFGCNTHEHDASTSYSGSFIAIAKDAEGNQVDTTVTGTP